MFSQHLRYAFTTEYYTLFDNLIFFIKLIFLFQF